MYYLSRGRHCKTNAYKEGKLMEKRLIQMSKRVFTVLGFAACLTVVSMVFLATTSPAKTAKEINSEVNTALKLFSQHVKGGKKFLDGAKGVLVIPKIVKAGLGVGGEYGEGALRIRGKTVGYYSLAAGSVGLQIGAQKMNLILVFMQDEALKKFRTSSGWKAGVDGSVAFIDVGKEKSLDTVNIKEPIVAFMFGQEGLMAAATIEGAKFTKLVR
jgi:lipid-binding SYLF domain-containing protein